MTPKQRTSLEGTARSSLPARTKSSSGTVETTEIRAKPISLPSESCESLHVLLVEQSRVTTSVLAEHLTSTEGCAFRLERTRSIPAAARAIESGRFDAVVMGLNLAEASALPALRQLRSTCDDIAFIVCCSGSTSKLRRDVLREGVQDCIAYDEPAMHVIGRCVLSAVERHRAQARQRQFDRWMSIAPDAVIVTSLAGHVQFVNPAAIELFGRSESELLGESIVFSGSEGLSSEIEILNGSERRIGEMRVAAVDWHGMPAILASIRDRTDRRQAELQLASADRLASLGTLAASIAHDINNPIAALIGTLDLAAEEAKHSGSTLLPQLLAEAQEAAHHIRTVAGDLRMFSRTPQEPRKPLQLDVQEVLQTSLRLAQSTLQQRARIICDFEPVPRVLGSDSQLVQVFVNLLINAAQATPQGGCGAHEIRIRTRARDEASVEIAISDTGSGMSQQTLSRLFTPFFTTKPPSLGTGLGLAICQRIVESHDGRIEVASVLGKGSTFTVLLPAATAAGPA